MSYQIPSYFTLDQQQAIMEEGQNILVSAAAGCGKTTLMVERIIRKVINDNIDINKMIVVTFTEAAASELKERLEKALYQKISNEEDNIKKEMLEKQINLLNDAYISTFHSLCLRLLKENNVEFQFDKPLRIADELQLNNLKYQCFLTIEKDLIDNEIYQDFKNYYTNLIDDLSLFQLFEKTLNLCISNGGLNYFSALYQYSQPYNSIFEYPIFGAILKQKTSELLNIISLIIAKSLVLDISEKTSIELTNLNNKIENLKSLLNENNYQAIYLILNDFSLFRKPSSKVDKATSYPAYHEIIKENVVQLKSFYLYDETDYKKIINTNNKNVKILLSFIQDYANLLEKEKRLLGILDFNDLEQETLKLLYKDDNYQGSNYSEEAIKLKSVFKEIMIDEYQDTNYIQEAIVQALSNNNIFMVGDIKQSIYKFRNALPTIFSEKYLKYQNNEGGLLINLSKNFRSKPNVLNTTNFVFEKIFSHELGGVDYDENQKLYFGNEKLEQEFPGEYPTKIFINYHTKEDKVNLKKSYLTTSLEVVNQIKQLVENNEDISYKNIVILFRNRNNASYLLDTLTDNQIPYMMHHNKGFFDSYEIKDLLNMLRVIYNYDDDLSLLTILKSPFFNYNDAQLLELKSTKLISDKKENYFNRLEIYDQASYELINNLKKFSNNNHPLELINYIYQITNYQGYAQANNTYDSFLMNINLFKEIIINNMEYYNSLDFLIQDLSLHINEKYDSSNPASISPKDDVINIMTIHQSKGLEFDYVFLIDENSFKFSERNKNKSISYFKEQLILGYFDTQQYIRADNPLHNLLELESRKENLAEEFRTLYVALTRAKKQLYIFRNLKDEKHEEYLLNLSLEEENHISTVFLLKTNYMSDSLIYSLAQAKKASLLRKDGFILNNISSIDLPLEISEYNKDLKIAKSKHIKRKEFEFEIVPCNINVDKKIKFKPSAHQEHLLNFDDIKAFDTFKQGNDTHNVLELLDFNSNNVLEQALNLSKKFNLYKRNIEGITSFLTSDFFNENIKNHEYYQEYSFMINDDKKVINGIIDLIVFKENNIYIIDYKSDHLSKDELISNYQNQLLTYQKIIEDAYPDKNVLPLIYSLYLKEFINII